MNKNEYRFDPGEHIVLRQVLDDKGRNAGDTLVKYFLDPTIRGLNFIGEGGIGKSTIEASAAVVALNRAGRRIVTARYKKRGRVISYEVPELGLIYLPFDERVRRAREAKGIHQRDWTSGDWSNLSRELYEGAQVALDNTYVRLDRLTPFETPNVKILMDMVAVGKFDKGQTAVSLLSQRPEQDVLTVGVLTDPLTQLRSGKIRGGARKIQEKYPEIPDESADQREERLRKMLGELEELLSQNKTVIRLRDPNRLPQLLAKMGPPDILFDVNAQIKAEIERWSALGRIFPKFTKLPLKVEEYLEDPELYRPYKDLYPEINPDYMKNWYKERWAHMRGHFDHLNVPLERRLILFNLHDPKSIIYLHQEVLIEVAS